MHFSLLTPLLALLPFTTSAIPSPQYLFTNPSSQSPYSTRIPTVHESAIQARRILKLSSIATLSTIFPSTSGDGRRPQETDGNPIGLMDYYASCSPTPSDPTILAIDIATAFRNAAAGSNVTLSLRYHAPYHHPPSDDIYEYSPANLPRFSLLGNVEPISQEEVERYNISGCFFGRHNEATAWKPGNEIHHTYWARLVVREVYWLGGFGDRAYIGWIPLEEWRGVTEEEVEECKLVGEEGYRKKEVGELVGAEGIIEQQQQRVLAADW